MASNDDTIPVVDFAGWWPAPDKDADGKSTVVNREARRRIARELTDACRRVGFAYVVNHGVPDELVAEAFAWSRRLFDLPREVKMLAPHPPGPSVHRGYSWPGLEKVSQYIHREGSDPDEEDAELRQVEDCKESFEIGSESNAEQPNVWPPAETEAALLTGFRPFMTGFYWSCFGAAREVLRALALGIRLAHRAEGCNTDKNENEGKEEEEEWCTSLDRFHSGHNGQLRLLHYPPMAAAAVRGGRAARMPAHTDWGSITLLFQQADDDSSDSSSGSGSGGGGGGGGGGLQVEHPTRPGTFVDAPPRPPGVVAGAPMVVNVGDLLMRWSNDFLRSTMHRVALPSLPPSPPLLDGDTKKGAAEEEEGEGEEAMSKARYSIPFFLSPDSDAVIECLPGCADEKNPARYGPVVQGEYRMLRAKLQYREEKPAGAVAVAV